MTQRHLMIDPDEPSPMSNITTTATATTTAIGDNDDYQLTSRRATGIRRGRPTSGSGIKTTRLYSTRCNHRPAAGLIWYLFLACCCCCVLASQAASQLTSPSAIGASGDADNNGGDSSATEFVSELHHDHHQSLALSAKAAVAASSHDAAGKRRHMRDLSVEKPSDEDNEGAAPAATTTATGGDQNSTAAESANNVHEREFVSPQVRIQMECQRDKTLIRVNFTRPFNGFVGAGKLDTTGCRLAGNGTRLYELQIQHNSTQCDTQWDHSTSSIFNTLFIRYHQSLETGNDLAKNVMCRLKVGDLIVGRRRRPSQSAGAAAAGQPTSPPTKKPSKNVNKIITR